jgi:hypothetical protein
MTENQLYLYTFNIPDTSPRHGAAPIEIQRAIENVPNRYRDPFMLYMYNGSINQLEDLVHDQYTVNFLNGAGLTIYLNEPLSSYDVNYKSPYPQGNKFTMWFYSEFNHEIDPKNLRADELDSIERYIDRNGLTSVTVRTGDYSVDYWYPYYQPKMALKCDDIFLKSVYYFAAHAERCDTSFTKKFINLNWRYTKHRHMVAAYVNRLPSYCSWYFKGDLDKLENGHWAYLPHWEEMDTFPDQYNNLKLGLTELNKKVPLNVDQNLDKCNVMEHHHFFNVWPQSDDVPPGSSPSTENIASDRLLKFYKDVFCDIITESRFAQPTANYSEKVYQAMFFRKPFILVAPPATLQYLRKEGFRTFDQFWNEHYDLTFNHSDRIGMIFQLIDSINGKSIEELRKMYLEMTDILDHNFNLVSEKLDRSKRMHHETYSDNKRV